MLDISSIPDQVLSDIMENRDTERESDLVNYSPMEALNYYLQWNGIIGYTGQILEAIDGLECASTIAEIRVVVDGTGPDKFKRVGELIYEKGHRKNPTLMLITTALDLGFAHRAIALIKIKELL